MMLVSQEFVAISAEANSHQQQQTISEEILQESASNEHGWQSPTTPAGVFHNPQPPTSKPSAFWVCSGEIVHWTSGMFNYGISADAPDGVYQGTRMAQEGRQATREYSYPWQALAVSTLSGTFFGNIKRRLSWRFSPVIVSSESKSIQFFKDALIFVGPAVFAIIIAFHVWVIRFRKRQEAIESPASSSTNIDPACTTPLHGALPREFLQVPLRALCGHGGRPDPPQTLALHPRSGAAVASVPSSSSSSIPALGLAPRTPGRS